MRRRRGGGAPVVGEDVRERVACVTPRLLHRLVEVDDLVAGVEEDGVHDERVERLGEPGAHAGVDEGGALVLVRADEEGHLVPRAAGDQLQRLIAELGLEKAKSSPTPGVREEQNKNDGENVTEEHLDDVAKREFRGGAGLAQYVALDRVGVKFASKEILRDASAPTQQSVKKLRRLGR